MIPALKNFARRFYTAQNEIDDLVQDTLLNALSNFDKFGEGTRLKSWFFTIMRNSFCTRFSLAKREHVGFDDNAAERILDGVLSRHHFSRRQTSHVRDG